MDLKSDAFEEFFLAVIHELKTPVNEITLLSQFIEEDNADSLDVQSLEDLASIRRTCGNMAAMIRELLDYFRSDTLSIEKAPVNMTALVRKLFTEASGSFPGCEPELVFGRMSNVRTDARLMGHVIKNILTNSLKYRHPDRDPVIRVSYVRKGDVIEYHFRDNGIGFDQKYAGNIFDPFVRLQNEDSYEGTGLGLSISRRSIERLGGSIRINGKKGSGCLTVISLPAEDIAEPGISDPSEKIRIGIIGDQSGIAKAEERSKTFAYRLAADEINASGGILGRKIELIFRDSQSDDAKTEAVARELTEDLHVDVLMGSTLSPSRDIMMKASERTETLYLNTQQTEGGAAGHYVFCLSAESGQQLRAMLSYLLRRYGKNCYIVAADYNYGILTAEWAKYLVRELGGEVVGTEYFDDKVQDFRPVINRIRQLNTDILISMCVYPNQDAFYEQWHEAGMNRIPNATTQIAAEFDQNVRFSPPILENTYVMASFLEDSPRPEAAAFVKKYRERYSRDTVPYMNMDTETAYSALYIYKAACEYADTTEAQEVIKALESGEISFSGPGGTVRVRGEDHHTEREMSCFRINKDHSLTELFRTSGEYSTYIEEMIRQKYGITGGIAAMGASAGTIQYNMLINKLIH